jgi:lipid-A-disaccharide synthase-like uncharacterized protein
MTGASPLAVAFLVAFIYALVESKTKWRTAFLVLGTMAAIIGLAYGMSFSFLNQAAMGTLGTMVALITGIAASLILIKREKRPTPDSIDKATTSQNP